MDLDTGEEILDLIEEITKDLQTSFFIVTHSKQIASRAQRVIEIRDGILAGHHTDVNLDALDQSRLITADEQGRILLPKEILNYFRDTKHFRAIISENSLILQPVADAASIPKISFETSGKKRITCSVCGMENVGRNILCSKCGGLLRKAGRI